MTVRTELPRSVGPSPLRGRYLAASPGLRAILTASDVALAPLRGERRCAVPPARLRRVLLAVNGHIGDAVIATAALRQLADARPDLELGVVLPTWARAALDGHPAVRWVHTLDHWHTDRGRRGPLAKWWRYLRGRHRTLREIRAVGYDAAVDLYDYFPNAAVLLWRAGIPIRVGYTSAGFSPCYTDPLPWPDDLSHTAERQAALMRVLIGGGGAATPQYDLPPARDETVRRVAGLLAREHLRAGGYTVLHVGAGTPAKEWPREQWRQVAVQLAQQGEALVFTGQGPAQRAAIHAIASGLPGCVDLADRLEWAEFVEVIRSARHLVSVDTAAAHVAAATGTPSTILWTSRSNPHHWRPLSDVGAVLLRTPEGDIDPAEVLASAAPVGEAAPALVAATGGDARRRSRP